MQLSTRADHLDFAHLDFVHLPLRTFAPPRNHPHPCEILPAPTHGAAKTNPFPAKARAQTTPSRATAVPNPHPRHSAPRALPCLVLRMGEHSPASRRHALGQLVQIVRAGPVGTAASSDFAWHTNPFAVAAVRATAPLSINRNLNASASRSKMSRSAAWRFVLRRRRIGPGRTTIFRTPFSRRSR